MDTPYHREIVELHKFFEKWYDGSIAFTDENFHRLHLVLNRDFAIIFPSGHLIERTLIVDRICDEHGTLPNHRRWVENIRILQQAAGLALAVYEEYQQIDGNTQGRLSTALFGDNPDAPNGVEWLHLHETWLA